MNFFQRLPLAYKIALPFVLINLLTASFAAPVAISWVREKIESEMKTRLENNLKQMTNHLKFEARRLKTFTRSQASNQPVQQAIAEKDLAVLRHLLAPQAAINELDFVEITDGQGKVIYNHNGPFPIGEDLKNLEIVKIGLQKVNSALLYKDYLIAAAPLYQNQSIAGLILAGVKMRPAMIKRELLGNQADFCLFLGDKSRLASTSLKLPHQPDPKLIKKTLKSGKVILRSETIRGNSFYVAYSPLRLNNLPVGTLVVKTSSRPVEKAMQTVIFNVILLNCLVVLIISICSYLLGRLIAQPIDTLAKAAEEVGRGNLNVKARLKTGDEIGALAQAFNQMTEKLKHQQEILNQKLSELSVIYDIALTISTTFDPNEILPILAESTRRVFDADIICVYISDRDSQSLKPGLCSKSSRLPQKCEKMLEERFLPELNDKPNLLETNPLKTAPFRSVMAQNMIAEGKTLGAIFVGSLDKNYTRDDLQVLTTLAQQAGVAIENAYLFDSLEKAYLGIVRALAIAIDARDPYTRGHSERVSELATELGKELGLSSAEIHELEMASYLHDIGKIGIPDDILMKPARLNNDEMRRVREHPSIGASILTPLFFLGEVVPAIKHHHEHYDGGGYPEGLRGKSIPLGARILSLADAFEAITSDRPYRKARSVEEAVKEIKRCSGTQFDPELVEAFIRVLKKKGIIESRGQAQ